MAKHFLHVILFLVFLARINSGVIEKELDKHFQDLLKRSDGARAEEKAGLFEGDIKMDESMQEALTSGKISLRDALINPIYHWPNAVLNYEIDESLNDHAVFQIHRAMHHIETHTCVRFRHHDRQPDQNYVIFFKGRGCYSMVGRNPKPANGLSQKISIGRGCTRLGTIVHEIMHALGFFHEQSRRDRDDFIKIVWSNIKPKHAHNFRKYSRGIGTNLDKPYDYLSVMHYPKYAFSRNRKATIIPRKKNAIIGQRYGLSYYDAYQINKLYKCYLRCIDRKHPFLCDYYAHKGYCYSRRHRRYMNYNCRRTCFNCGIFGHYGTYSTLH